MNIRKNIKQNFKIYLSLFLVMALMVTVIELPVSESYAFKVSKDPDSLTPAPLVTDLEDEYIKVLDDISIYNENVIDSELIMLEDIVERSYNNDFDIKSYIIKTKDRELDKTYYSSYLRSRGDIHLSATFDENTVVYDGKEYYYHSITANVIPAFDKFDYETRKVEQWDEYIKAVHEAEKEIGYIEIEDEEYKDNALCDYQLINQTLAWMAKHVEHGTSDNISNQSALSGVLEGRFVCAGYARLFNRFMHDFRIDSYWVSIPSMNHAANFVKLGDEYYSADTDCADALFSHTHSSWVNSLGNQLYDFNSNLYQQLHNEPFEDGIYGDKKYLSEYEFYAEYNAIIHYYPYIEEHKYYYYTATEPLRNWENTEYFDVEGSVDEHCTYCGKHHYFPLGGDTIVTKKEPLVKNSYFFKGSYRKFDYDIFNWVDVQEFHIYEGSGMDDMNKKDICPEGVDTTTQPITTTPADVNTTSTSGVVESTGDSNNNTTTIAVSDTTITDNNATSGVINITTTKNKDSTTIPAVLTQPVVKNLGKVNLTGATRKKASNKIKITLKKVVGAKKYQIAVYKSKSDAKKNKGYLVRKSFKKIKNTIQSRRLKNRKKLYVRVRAVNGKVYGKWSKIVRVKIKK